jgi:Uma2 family endonuclease
MAPVGVERPRVSYADLERMPEDGRRYELYDGEVFVVPAPVPRHQIVQIALTELLRRWAGRHGGFVVGSPIDIIFTEHDVLQPDVVLFRPERTHLIDLDRPIRHVPDLCVEVLSPSTAAADRGRKMQAFARFGVPEYWIADPALRSIEVYRLARDGYVLEPTAGPDTVVTSPTFDGLTVSTADVFP